MSPLLYKTVFLMYRIINMSTSLLKKVCSYSVAVFVLAFFSFTRATPVAKAAILANSNATITVIDASNLPLKNADVRIIHLLSGQLADDFSKADPSQNAKGMTDALGRTYFHISSPVGFDPGPYLVQASYQGGEVMAAGLLFSSFVDTKKITIKLPYVNPTVPNFTLKVVDAQNKPLKFSHVYITKLPLQGIYNIDVDKNQIVDNLLKPGTHDAEIVTDDSGIARFFLSPSPLDYQYTIVKGDILKEPGFSANGSFKLANYDASQSVTKKLTGVNPLPDLHVKVVDAKNLPVKGAQVEVINVKKGKVAYDFTNGEGVVGGAANAVHVTNSNGQAGFFIHPSYEPTISNQFTVRVSYMNGPVSVGFVYFSAPSETKNVTIKLPYMNLSAPNVEFKVVDDEGVPLKGRRVLLFPGKSGDDFDQEHTADDLLHPNAQDVPFKWQDHPDITYGGSSEGYYDYKDTSHVYFQRDAFGTTDAAGKVGFVVEPGKFYSYRVEGFTPGQENPQLFIPDYVKHPVTVKLTSSDLADANFLVKVVDANQKPLSGVSVVVLNPNAGPGQSKFAQDVSYGPGKDAKGTTNNKGRVSFELAPSIWYQYRVGNELDAPGFMVQGAVGPLESPKLRTIRLWAKNAVPNVNVVVKDANGLVLKNADVEIVHTLNATPAFNFLSKTSQSPAKGKTNNKGKIGFLLNPPDSATDPGPYFVRVSYKGGVTILSGLNFSAPTYTAKSVTVQLPYVNNATNVQANVMDQSNHTIKNATVRFFLGLNTQTMANDLKHPGDHDAQTPTDASGNAYMHLGKGTYTYTIEAPGFTKFQGAFALDKTAYVFHVKLSEVPKLLLPELPECQNCQVPPTVPAVTTTPPVVVPPVVPQAKFPTSLQLIALGSLSLSTGQSSPMEAKVTYNTGSVSYVTPQCAWSVSDPQKAQVSNGAFLALSGIGQVAVLCEYQEAGKLVKGLLTFDITLDPALVPVGGGSVAPHR